MISKAGRREIEIAVGLDSGNALLRSYLGKAYFEENRAPLDATQLGIAKSLDPLDPTPYLYDALRKQSEGRTGEALKDIQGSIARNDNRAGLSRPAATRSGTAPPAAPAPRESITTSAFAGSGPTRPPVPSHSTRPNASAHRFPIR